MPFSEIESSQKCLNREVIDWLLVDWVLKKMYSHRQSVNMYFLQYIHCSHHFPWKLLSTGVIWIILLGIKVYQSPKNILLFILGIYFHYTVFKMSFKYNFYMEILQVQNILSINIKATMWGRPAEVHVCACADKN